jgi:DnaK suppressor protein
MNPTIVNEFKTQFLELLAQEEKLTTLEAEKLDSAGDEIDVLNQEKLLQLDQRLQTRQTVYLKKVKYALEKIEAGTFGECEECGADISISRLKARPTATMCIHCKEEQERGEWHQKDKNRHSQKMNNVLPINQVNKSWTQSEDLGALMSIRSQDPDFAETSDF